MMSRWARILVAGAGLGLAAAAAALGALYRSLPQIDGEAVVAGLRAPADVVRDAHGVPHVYARDLEDAYFGLGYAHAQDRLWQMDLHRRVGAGRLAEILGERALPTDRVFRVLGLVRHARITERRLDASTRRLLEAYAGGVNAWLDAGHSLPIEHTLLRVAPERWALLDSLLLLRVLAWQLSGNWGAELWRLRLASVLTPEELGELQPPHPGEPALGLAGAFGAYAELELPLAPLGQRQGRAVGVSTHRRASVALAPAAAALARLAPARLGEAIGSNNWAVAAARSSSGAPLLANDPHLELKAPSQWYLAHLEAPDVQVVGASLPGIPGIILGRNAHVAWAFTNTLPDSQDLFIEKLEPGRNDHYATPDGPRPFERHEELINVRGADPVRIEVRRTRHGPVISDADPEARGLLPAGYVLALAWTGFDDDDQTIAFPGRAARARSGADLLEAARSFHAPQQNIVYADTAGSIGFVAAGHVPLRKPENVLRGLVPAPGWLDAYDWAGRLPFEALPQERDPASARLLTANQNITPPGYPHWLGAEWAAPFRAQRIARRLDERPRHSLDSFASIQLDVFGSLAERVLPAMLDALPRPAAAPEALALLEAWRFEMSAVMPQPLIFAAWLREIGRGLYADELGDLFEDEWAEKPEFVRRVLGGDAAHWCDDRRTAEPETCDRVVAEAWRRAIAQLSDRFGSDPAGWSWGAAHRAVARHPLFGELPVLAAAFNLVTARSGDSSSVDAASYWVDEEESAFENHWGPGFRALYDLADLESSRAVLSTGQSGHVLSPHYRDMFRRWAAGGYVPLLTQRERVDADAEGTLRLKPRIDNFIDNSYQ